MKDSVFLLGAIVLLATALSVPFGYDLVNAFTKSLFEGNSYAKTVLFIGWIVFLLVMVLLRERKIARPVKNRHSFIALVAVLALLWAFQIHLHVAFLNSNSMLGDSTAAALAAENGIVEWSATQLAHIHITKGALYPIVALLPFSGFDSGYPMSTILQFPHSLFFLALAVVFLLLVINEFLGLENRVEQALFVVFSYGALVSIFDGGPFSIVGKISIALLAALFLLKREGTKSFEFFLGPFFFLAGILYFGSFYFDSHFFAFGAYEVLLIGAMLSAAMVFNAKKIEKPVWLAILLILVYHGAGHLASIQGGAEFFEGENAEIFIYGLPEGTTESELRAVFGDSADVLGLEIYNYVAFAAIRPSHFFNGNLLNEMLAEGLEPESYLFAVRGFERHRAIIKSDHDLEYLQSLDSGYISFRRQRVLGGEELVVEGLFPHPYLDLFALSSLYYDKGVEKPVVFSKVI